MLPGPSNGYPCAMDYTPRVCFVTPVYGREAMTAACLRQRRDMLDELPFDAQAVVIGDDGRTFAVARDLGFEVIEMDNDHGVGRKFNAGYQWARREGFTHCMPIGSDSWLHPAALAEAPFTERGGLALIGLSSISPWGDERLDLEIKYPAGFGVGMVYPTWALHQGGGADPKRNSGIDTSTWSRCGRGRLQIEFLPVIPQGYVNFHSPTESITNYYDVLGTHRRKARLVDDPWRDLILAYGRTHVDAVQRVYAVASIGYFLRGERPGVTRAIRRQEMLDRQKLPGHKGRKPARRLDGSIRETYQRRVPPNEVARTYTEIVDNFKALTE